MITFPITLCPPKQGYNPSVKSESLYLQQFFFSYPTSWSSKLQSQPLTVLTHSRLHWIWQICRYFVADCYRCEKYSRFSHSLDKNVWEGTEDESAVGSIQLQESLSALSMWLSSAALQPLSYGSYCMSSCALWVQIASERKEDEKAASVLYLYKYEAETDSADTSVVEVYSEGMDLAGLKCQTVHMEFCFIPDRDRDNTSTPSPPAPSSFSSHVVNEKLLCRGQPSIVAV